MKVFLGGTCAGTTWREELKPLLTIDYFDPVVDDWTPECQAEEERQKKTCDYSLYVLSPEMKGMFSVAELVNDSIKRDVGKTVMCVLGSETDWGKAQFKSLHAVASMVHRNGGYIVNFDELPEENYNRDYSKLKEVANYLNNGAR